MKKINRLIKRARQLTNTCIAFIFPGNEDGFIDALGVDPEKYKRTSRDGAVGYDFMAALNDIAAECWEEVI